MAVADKTTPAEIGLIAASALTPFAPFLANWIWPGLFADMLRPIVSQADLTTIVPRLSNDLDVIAEYYFNYAPDPYLYTYFVALLLSTTTAIGGSVVMFVRKTSSVRLAEVRKRMRSIWMKIGTPVFLILLVWFMWAGPSLIYHSGCRRCMQAGPLHDGYMIFFLFGYTFFLIGGAGLLRLTWQGLLRS